MTGSKSGPSRFKALEPEQKKYAINGGTVTLGQPTTGWVTTADAVSTFTNSGCWVTT